VNYHFADEAQQIRRLMQAAPAQKAGEPEDPGMTEEGAAYAVLGTDIETLGASVARGWGLDDAVMTMIRRLPLTTAVHSGGSDYDTLRAVAACANEAVDAVGLPAARVPAALTRVLQRYGRLLGIGPKDLQEALQVASASRQETPGSPAEAPLEVALRRS
jgi:non-specific serine/threonine protein kinase